VKVGACLVLKSHLTSCVKNENNKESAPNNSNINSFQGGCSRRRIMIYVVLDNGGYAEFKPNVGKTLTPGLSSRHIPVLRCPSTPGRARGGQAVWKHLFRLAMPAEAPRGTEPNIRLGGWGAGGAIAGLQMRFFISDGGARCAYTARPACPGLSASASGTCSRESVSVHAIW